MPKINDTIVPASSIDEFPTHLASLGKGGLRTVKNKKELDSIPSERCEEGMIVYISDLSEFWYLSKIARESKERVWNKLNSKMDITLIDDNNTSREKIWSSDKIEKEIKNSINDSTILDSKTWSSEKIVKEIKDNKLEIDDTRTPKNKTWSSNKIYSTILEETSNLIDDSNCIESKVWSSKKTKDEINSKINPHSLHLTLFLVSLAEK